MIRGTSNQSISSMTRSVQQAGYELGPTNPGGGAGQPNAGAVEYREIDNATPGTVFIPSFEHLPDGTPQVRTTV